MADPVFGFNESDAHNLVRLIRNDRTDLDETPLPSGNYTLLYIAELIDDTWSTYSEDGWSTSVNRAKIFDLKNTQLQVVGPNDLGQSLVADPLGIFSGDLKSGDRLYCIPFEGLFIAIQAPCGG